MQSQGSMRAQVGLIDSSEVDPDRETGLER